MRLVENQLAALVDLDRRCAEMYYAIGFDAATVTPLSEGVFRELWRRSSVQVAEADHEVAGLLAWHEESPGVAYLQHVSVHPSYQRFGIASQLLEAMRKEARTLPFEEVVVRCWEKAPWAMVFFRRHGFAPIDAKAPARVQHWKEERLATGQPLVRPGEIALWSTVAPSLSSDDVDMSLLTGEFHTDPGRSSLD
jgi:amino-acid N-acetyltransferase